MTSQPDDDLPDEQADAPAGGAAHTPADDLADRGPGRPSVWPYVAVLAVVLVLLAVETVFVALPRGPVPWYRWLTLAVIVLVGVVFVTQRRRR